MLIWWKWNLGGGPAGQPNLCFLFLSSSGRRAIGESRRACRANIRALEKIVGSENVGQTGRTRVKSSMEEKPSSSQTHSYFLGGGGDVFFILGEFHEAPF